ncbi:hypothetical protein [Phenylobacterium sp.]|uniref:hypothetical protein n=1 Tax=Phenylobacterium sp. TaxID=1871053 RepID=UPI00301C4B4A
MIWLRILTPRAWAVLALAVVVLALFAWAVSSPARRAAAGAKVEAAAAAARARAAGDAVVVVVDGAARDSRTDRLTQETSDAIDALPGARQRLDPELNRAGRHGLCQYAAYRQHPDCLQRPVARELPQADPRR